MRFVQSLFVLGAAIVGLGIWVAPGCSSRVPAIFTQGADDQADGGVYDPFDGGDPMLLGIGDGGPSCEGRECQVVSCGNGNTTTVSGTVYDPAGRTPLYNVYVYVPNADLSDITSGATCSACQAPASGSPMQGAQLTDAKGHFTLTNVPVGQNIPLVMQLGKFRRMVTIAQVNQCVDNPVGKKDSKSLETITRMPRKQKEGSAFDNIPLIAMATGACDQLECLMRKIGIADSEFSASGRIHLYQGIGGASGPGSSDAYAFWANKAALIKHDIVINSCECDEYDRTPAGYKAMRDYLDGGGRAFGTHYHYNWYASGNSLPDFNGTAEWRTPTGGSYPPFYINTTFPKGAAFSDWIQNIYKNNTPPPKGQITLDYAAEDVGRVKGTTTSWIYYGDADYKKASTAYLSFNTPVASAPANQCGRAVFSDLHVSSGGGGSTFPGECGDATVAMTQQETALEFLFFDLSSCVGDDTQPPPPPPPN